MHQLHDLGTAKGSQGRETPDTPVDKKGNAFLPHEPRGKFTPLDGWNNQRPYEGKANLSPVAMAGNLQIHLQFLGRR